MTAVIQNLLNGFMSLGYFGVALALMIEIIPSELVLAFGGYMITKGHLNLIGVIAAGTIGGTLAQLFLYWIGYYGGRPFLEKYGKYLFIHKKQLDLSEQWFQRYGTSVIFFARFIPIVRHAISIPAGIAKMSLIRFSFYTILAIIPWSILFVIIGKHLGKNWSAIKEITGPYVHLAAIIVITAGIVYLLFKFMRKKYRP